MAKRVYPVEEFIAENINYTDIEDKKKLAEAWTEARFEATGKFPSSIELQRLADWLLSDELQDISRSKVQKKEYPILSKPQLERRHRELSMEENLVDTLHQKRMNNHSTRKKDTKKVDY